MQELGASMVCKDLLRCSKGLIFYQRSEHDYGAVVLKLLFANSINTSP